MEANIFVVVQRQCLGNSALISFHTKKKERAQSETCKRNYRIVQALYIPKTFPKYRDAQAGQIQ